MDNLGDWSKWHESTEQQKYPATRTGTEMRKRTWNSASRLPSTQKQLSRRLRMSLRLAVALGQTISAVFSIIR